jgi:hypothetical protein
MTPPTESFYKVPYDLRPAKQIERRMLIDAFQRLSFAGFPIGEYQYTGMGSIYFVDFILFHKLLGIDKLLSVEISSKITKRLRFNKPFQRVDIQICPIGDVIPQLSRDRRHILWLDYDGLICSEFLRDLVLAGTYLSAGSILLVTVDVEPPEGNSPKEWRDYYAAEASAYLGKESKVEDFVKTSLVARNTGFIKRAIMQGLVGREAEFIPMFNFIYADGHNMLTIGGMIGTQQERRQLKASSLNDTSYFRSNLEIPPYAISVPRLTRKERLYLDGFMPCNEKWKPKEFELPPESVLAYREIYRFFPAYAELLL